MTIPAATLAKVMAREMKEHGRPRPPCSVAELPRRGRSWSKDAEWRERKEKEQRRTINDGARTISAKPIGLGLSL